MMRKNLQYLKWELLNTIRISFTWLGILNCLFSQASYGQSNPYQIIQTHEPTNLYVNEDIGVADLNRDGRPDITAPNTMFTFGAHGAFEMINLSDQGQLWSRSQSTVHAGGANAISEMILRHAHGDFDGDGWKDLISFSNQGRVQIFENQWHTHVQNGFQRVQLIDDLSTSFLLRGQFDSFDASRIIVDDFDNDGYLDFAFGSRRADFWTSTSAANALHVYFGNGNLTFTRQDFPTHGEIIDLRLDDFDNRTAQGATQKNTLAILSEDMNIGSYSVWVELFQITGRQLIPKLQGSLAQNAQAANCFGRIAQLELIDSDLDMDLDFLFMSETGVSQQIGGGNLCLQEGLPNGRMSQQWVSLPIPNSTTEKDRLRSIKVVDYDHDGVDDLAGVMAYKTQNGALFLLKNWGGNFANFSLLPSLTLPGTVTIINEFHTNQSFQPFQRRPDILQVGSLESDPYPDLFVGGITIPNQRRPNISVIQNIQTLQFSDSKIRFIGDGNPAQRNGVKGMIGVEGQPRVGETLSINFLQAPGGATVALAFDGVLTQFQFFHIPIHVYALSGGSSRHLQASGNAASLGFYFYQAPIPNDPSLVGQSIYFQWFARDGQGQTLSEYSASNALEVKIGR